MYFLPIARKSKQLGHRLSRRAIKTFHVWIVIMGLKVQTLQKKQQQLEVDLNLMHNSSIRGISIKSVSQKEYSNQVEFNCFFFSCRAT